MSPKAASPLETPMMKQYLATKDENPDALLFMRMGDFYELFLDDAVDAARILGITLTSRNKGAEVEVPMAGVPHHSLQQHLPKLLAEGRRVAIMDQLEDPSETRGLVRRGLTRVITAGTLIDEEELPDGDAHPLLACTALDGPGAVAALDCATGKLHVEAVAGAADLALALARWQPAEVLLPDPVATDPDTRARLAELTDDPEPPPVAGIAGYAWDRDDAARFLCEHFRVAALDGFGLEDGDDDLIAVAAAALRYARTSTGSELRHVHRVVKLGREQHLVIDGRSRRNLELVRNQLDRSRRHTLLASVDHTRTAPGARLLARWLARPLADDGAIRTRHDAVAALLADDHLRADLRDALARVYDLERLLGRIGTGRAHARDLVQLATTLERAEECRAILARAEPPALLVAEIDALAPAAAWRRRCLAVLVDDPPLGIGDGGMVRDGIDPELDELRDLRASAGDWLADYRTREAARIGLPRLKVGYNKVFGYYVEVGKARADQVPEDFVRKQTLTNAERFITPELKEYEEKVLGAEEKIRQRETGIFAGLRDEAAEHLAAFQDCADALATVDVIAGLAECARRKEWCRPEGDDSLAIELRGARHPVVEDVIGRDAFVANDAGLDAAGEGGRRLAVITGPNMAGKSTFIRQVALAVVLAQAGCYVPAESARIGVVDRLFTRIGAGDELARNMSTFMVEMAETAAILHNATRRSLVILDEVGRGTSTFDGLSLAWAITEHLHDRVGCRCLFATHYHELTDLAEERTGIVNLTVEVAETGDEVVFLHRIQPGAATKSYGIHVARIAGVPPGVVARAREVLATIDTLGITLGERESPQARREGAVQLTLFEAASHPAVEELAQVDLDETSPRAAWDLLARLQRQARS